MKIMLASNIKNDDDYREVVKARMLFAVILIVLGVITFLLTITTNSIFEITLNDHQSSYYKGMGTGLIVGGIVLLIKFGMLLKNEQKLKESRIKSTDERVQSISKKALVSAGIILFLSIYVLAIVGGIFHPILTKAALVLIAIFLLSYVILYRIFAARS